MRHALASFVVLCAAASPAALQRGGAPGSPAIRACSLLTREVVTQVSPQDKEVLDLVLRIQPQEDLLGAAGSACSYGGITLQVDPFPAATLEKQRDKTWAAVPGVGDTAYFRDNSGRWAELYALAGAHVLTIQMGIPMDRTAESIKPNVVALARAVVPKLK